MGGIDDGRVAAYSKKNFALAWHERGLQFNQDGFFDGGKVFQEASFSGKRKSLPAHDGSCGGEVIWGAVFAQALQGTNVDGKAGRRG
ncbi:hypothetical protein CIW54_00940 [Paraburkholderia sp. T12-10]|nr:hypothetical protein CIW54_00940 [Paraburkholderia sp. T12-10]